MLCAARRLAFIFITIVSVSCAEPPHKEMNQALGAIDAARAAGADKFAAAEFTAATDALKRSEDAAASGDYRQALSHAIDSRERAANAARMAVTGRADARGHAERAIAEVATLLARAQTQLKHPDLARPFCDQLCSGFWQRRRAQLQVGAKHRSARLLAANLCSDCLNGQTPQGVTRAMGKQDDGWCRCERRGHVESTSKSIKKAARGLRSTR